MWDFVAFDLRHPDGATQALQTLYRVCAVDWQDATPLSAIQWNHAQRNALPSGIWDALCELIAAPRTGTDGRLALAFLLPQMPLLSQAHRSVCLDALLAAAQMPLRSFRQDAIAALGEWGDEETIAALLRMICEEPVWTMRQGAIRAIGKMALRGVLWQGKDPRWSLLAAIDDPHWRVRNELLQILLGWRDEHPEGAQEAENLGETQDMLASDAFASSIVAMLSEKQRQDPIVQGMLHYLAYRWSEYSKQPSFRDSLPGLGPPPKLHEAPWWDADPPVVRRQLLARTKAKCRQELDWMPALLSHADAGARKHAAECLQEFADTPQFLEILDLLEEPRTPFLVEQATPLLSRLSTDRKERICRALLARLSEGTPCGLRALAWALSQIPSAWPLQTSSDAEAMLPMLEQCLDDPRLSVEIAALECCSRLLVASTTTWKAIPAAQWIKALETALASPVPALACCGLASVASLVAFGQQSEAQRNKVESLSRALWYATPELFAAQCPAWSSKGASEKRLVTEQIAHYAVITSQPWRVWADFWKEAVQSPFSVLRILAAHAALKAQDSLDAGKDALNHGDTRESLAPVALELSSENPETPALQTSSTPTALLALLQEDPDPRVREAALSLSRAQWIREQPQREASWRVRQRAARLLKLQTRLLGHPESKEPLQYSTSRAGSISSQNLGESDGLVVTSHVAPMSTEDLSAKQFIASDSASYRTLGQTGFEVSVLGISGHYGLPTEGFVQALDAGVNLYFWEPNYSTQTRFYHVLSPRTRRQLVTVCGTFQADTSSIQRDLEYALKSLQVEQISVWLIFWVRSWARLSDEVRTYLERCQREGKIGHYGMSTHDRGFALRAMEEDWKIAMVRHNAAHRGAEAQIFPTAHQQNIGMFTFNNLIYGRILRPTFEVGEEQLLRPTAADCYRYSLSQPGVTACFSAPGDLTQLAHNLPVLGQPVLREEAQARLRAYGDRVYLENRMFADCLRNRGSDI